VDQDDVEVRGRCADFTTTLRLETFPTPPPPVRWRVFWTVLSVMGRLGEDE